MTQKADPQTILMRLGVLLQLQRRARQAEHQELPFILVNETRLLIPYRQATFWQIKEDGTWKVAAVSGLAAPDPGAPFVLWLESMAKALKSGEQFTKAARFNKVDLPEELAESWAEWLPGCGLWLPLITGQKIIGVLALFRPEEFQDPELELLGHLSESYSQSLTPPQIAKKIKFKIIPNKKSLRFWLLIAAVLILLFPARQSVLAPAEVIALKPAHIRAPLDGVIKHFSIAPNQMVRKGDKLVSLEDDQLKKRLVVAQKDLEISRAELQQNQQLSLVDPKAKVRLPMLEGRVSQLIAELELVKSQLARVSIASPVSGIAIFDDPDVWLGRPVSLGQKILEVANPTEVQLEITLPISEALPLNLGDSLLFFPNVNPHEPLDGSLIFIGYQASETAEAGLAFKLRASFDEGQEDLPRLGLRGTAKLYGRRMPLIVSLLRRPILQLRQFLGL